MNSAFYRLDVSDSGTITLADLRPVLPASITDAEVQQLLTRADHNNYGVLDLMEFHAPINTTEEVERIRSTTAYSYSRFY